MGRFEMGAIEDLNLTLKHSIAAANAGKYQRACWPVRNHTTTTWWRRAKLEPQRWVCMQVPDSRTGEGVRDVFLSPDGRLAIRVNGGNEQTAAVREIYDVYPEWNLDQAFTKVIATLHRQPVPCIVLAY